MADVDIRGRLMSFIPPFALPYLRSLLVATGVRGRYDSFAEANECLNNNDGHGQYPINIMRREDVLFRILNSGYRLVAEWPSFDLMPVKIGVRSINLQSQGFMVSRK